MESSCSSTHYVHPANAAAPELFHSPVPYMILYHPCQSPRDSHTFLLAVPGSLQRIPLTGQQAEQLKHRSLHQHNFLEILFVLSGTAYPQIEETQYKCSAGECYILNRSIRHREEVSAGSESLVLMISRDFLMRLIRHDAQHAPEDSCSSSLETVRRLLEQTHQDFSCPAKEYAVYSPLPLEHAGASLSCILEEFRALFRLMAEETRSRKPGSIFVMEGLITRFFSMLEMPGLYRKSLIRLACTKEELLVNKITYIFEACHGNIGREELALLLNYNSDYLNRIVKRQTGMSLMSYGQLFCLKEAERLLLESSKSIAEIVRGLGFSNRSYFYRVFEKKYGMTPKEYRKFHSIYF